MSSRSAARTDGLPEVTGPSPLFRRVVHALFEASLAIKAALCSAELVAGLGLLFVPVQRVNDLVFWLTHFQIADDPSDPLANWSRHAIGQFTSGTEQFYGWYLLAHGGLKLVMVAMLWRKVVWAYPVSMAVLAGFVLYQGSEFVTHGSPFLLVLSCFDLFMIWLVWQEYRLLRGKVAPLAIAAPPR